MLKQRLTWEIRSLQRSKEQLLTEGVTPAQGRAEGAGPASWSARPRPDAPPTRREFGASQAAAGGAAAALAACGRGRFGSERRVSRERTPRRWGRGREERNEVDAPVPSATPPRRAGSRAGRRGLSAHAHLLPGSSIFDLSQPPQVCVSVASFPSPSTFALYFLLSPLHLLRRLKAELEKFGGHDPAQTQSTPGDPADKGEVGTPGRGRGEQGGRQSGRVCPQNPSERGSVETRASPGE